MADFPAVGLYGQSALGVYQPDFRRFCSPACRGSPVRVLFGHAVRAIDQTPQDAVLSVDCSDARATSRPATCSAATAARAQSAR